ncbi:MAG: methyltransferase domain-containing protein [Sedimenticolaceae bacterium]
MTTQTSFVPHNRSPQGAEAPVNLEFSEKYDSAHSKRYFEKHQSTLARRLSHWRESHMVRRALEYAACSDTVLDLPCGAGRFWPLLAERKDRVILAADNSADMIKVALECQPSDVTRRINAFQTSAFKIELDDGSVDLIFCIRLLHHVSDAEHRLAILREFNRVARSSVIVSLWVDGNYKAWRRGKAEKRRKEIGEKERHGNRFVVNRQQIESEFKEAGFRISKYFDFLPKYAMWRTYVLEKG